MSLWGVNLASENEPCHASPLSSQRYVTHAQKGGHTALVNRISGTKEQQTTLRTNQVIEDQLENKTKDNKTEKWLIDQLKISKKSEG